MIPVRLTAYPPQPATEADTAIVVCHGMGQQVPFETLDGVAEALVKAETEARHPAPAPAVTLLRDGNSYLPRAELTLTDSQNHSKRVHLYEVYWAPITEGQVRTLDVLSFLLDGGREGLISSIKGSFKRFLYGEWRAMEVKRATGLLILVILNILTAIVLHYLAIAVLLLGTILPLLGLNALNPTLLARAQLNWQWTFVTVLVAVFVGLALFIRKVLLGDRGSNNSRPAMKRWMHLSLTILIVLVSATSLCANLAILFDWPKSLNLISPFLNLVHLKPLVSAHFREISLLALSTWACLLWFIDIMFVEYVGDVAAYISAYKLNKFWTVRERIQEVAFNVSRAVYGQDYGTIIMVGHSLGSVVAYDAYNAMVREDQMLHGGARNVVDRTKALVTFGSPLDKTAYLFRQHLKATEVGVREGLAEAVQPLIASFANWPREWINIWSPADIISGQLDYYQLPAGSETGKTVTNLVDYEANYPLLAHTQYWNNHCLRETLYRLCTI
jgi:hypothetical protein